MKNPDKKITAGIKRILFLFLIGLITNIEILPQQLAFPGAEGHGKYTSGGRGGKVIEVVNLNDSGPGSFRDAVNQSGARTIVFKVSGTIFLNSTLEISNGNLTIAGQTSPGDGICIAGYPVRIEADNIIIRYMRFRLGDINAVEDDAIWGRNNSDIIIDHCSMSWSTDECASFYDNENFTLQWCILSESLYYSVHAKGSHGYGGIWGGMKASFLNNLLAHHTSRTPRFNGSRYHRQPQNEIVDHANNVIYNWGFNSAYGGEGGSYNVRNNYYKKGPATDSDVADRILNPWLGDDGYANWFVDSNYVEGFPEVTENNWEYGVHNVLPDMKDSIYSEVLFDDAGFSPLPAEEAYIHVLENAGAILPRRDDVDKRIVDEVRTGTATYGVGRYNQENGLGNEPSGIIDSQEDVGGWPNLYTGPVPEDSDSDGMPDNWELENSLDPNDPSDRNDIGEDGYTNLEIYLNSIERYPPFLIAPTNLTGELIAATTIELTWTDNTENESGFKVQRSVEDNNEFTTIAEVGANETTYIDSNLEEFSLYSYRVVAFNDSLESGFTNIIELTTLSPNSPPLAVSNPSPEDGIEYVITTPTLVWGKSINAESYDVYFGKTNPPSFIGNQTETNYKPGELERGRKYYWRIDAVNSNGVTEGDIWSFSVKPEIPSRRIVYWKFDETSGTTVLDNEEFNIDGTMINMSQNSRVEGIADGALYFDGIDDFVIVQHNGIIDFQEESFSISLWLKAEPLTGSSMYLLNKGSFTRDNAAGTSGKWYGIEIKNNELRFAVDDDVIKTQATVDNIDTILPEKWTHITCVRDTAERMLKLYVNGELLAYSTDTTGSVSQEEDMYLGNNSTEDAPFEGLLDEVGIYNYALSETEVQKLYDDNITNVNETENAISKEHVLKQNYPNPFNPTTSIKYQVYLGSAEAKRVSRIENVTLKVYDILGREIKTLVNKVHSPGTYEVNFDASGLTSGVYFYTLRVGEFISTKKMILLR